MKTVLRRGALLMGISGWTLAAASAAAQTTMPVPDQATPVANGSAQVATPATATSETPPTTTGVTPSQAGTVAATPAASTQASSDNEPQSGQINDIIVTAQKRSERINDVPLAITAASGTQLQALGITNIADLPKITPGFQFSQTGINAVYTLRGVGFYDNTLAARGAVAVYEDEVALPFAILTPVATFDLDRVEILKGPQGTLFGQNSTGGAVNYIAAKPTDHLTYGVSGEAGRFGRGYLETFVSGPLTDTLAVRVSSRTEFGGDWQKSYTRNYDNTIGARMNVAGRVQLAWNPTPGFRANLQVSGYYNDSDPQTPQYVGTSAQFSNAAFPPSRVLNPLINPYPAPPANNRYSDWDANIPQRQRDRILFTSLRVEKDLGDHATITSLTGYSDYRKDARRDVDGTAVSNDTITTTGNNQVFQQELRVAGDAGSRLHYIVGGNYEQDHAYQDDYFNVSTTGSVAVFYNATYGKPYTGADAFTRLRYYSKSAFGDLDFKLFDNLTVRGGVRYTKLDGHGEGCIIADDEYDIVRFATAISINRNRAAIGLAPITIARNACYTSDGITPGLATPQLHEHNVAWRGGLDWKITPTILLYGNVSKGYKSGSFPQVLGTNTSQFNPATQESVMAYEVGAKAGLFDRHVQVNGALFYYDYTDKQFLGRVVTLTGVAPVLVNVPTSRVKGAEIQADWQVTQGLHLTAAGTYLDTRVGAFTNYDAFGVIRNFEGNRFPFAPKFQGTVDASYEFPVSSVLSAYVGASGVHQSSTFSAFGELPLLFIKSYSTMDARIGITNKEQGWRLGLYGRNLTDTYYWNNVVRAFDTVVRYTGLPRTFGVTFSIRR